MQPYNPQRTTAVTCALLTSFRHDWAAELIAASPGLRVITLSPESIGLPDAPNPFGLGAESRADVVVISNIWLKWLRRHNQQTVERVLKSLEKRAEVLVGLDSTDDFGIGFLPSDMRYFALVLKPQGLYRDRDLYNFRVGAWYPDALWTDKVRPRRGRFSEADLDKLRLSVPCFMIDLPSARRVARDREHGDAATGREMSVLERRGRDAADVIFNELLHLAPAGRPTRTLDAHCVVTLTHIQRIRALEELDGLSGMRGIVSVPDYIAGLRFRDEWTSADRDDIVRAAAPHKTHRRGRFRYWLELARHKVAVAPTGYGELGNRHAAAMRAGAALVCQDMSHVEMMFPIVDGVNAAFCRPDLGDLRRVVDDLLGDDDHRRSIARRGRATLAAWSRASLQHLYDGVTRHLEEALGRQHRGLPANDRVHIETSP